MYVHDNDELDGQAVAVLRAPRSMLNTIRCGKNAYFIPCVFRPLV